MVEAGLRLLLDRVKKTYAFIRNWKKSRVVSSILFFFSLLFSLSGTQKEPWILSTYPSCPILKDRSFWLLVLQGCFCDRILSSRRRHDGPQRLSRNRDKKGYQKVRKEKGGDEGTEKRRR